MSVRLKQGLAGNTETWKPGDVFPCSQEEGDRLIAAGIAEPATDGDKAKAQKDEPEHHEKTKVLEVAAVAPPENAALRKGRAKP